MKNNEFEDENLLKIQKQKKKLKIIILSVFAVCIVFAVVFTIILSLPAKKVEGTDYSDALSDYEFFPVEITDIFYDPDYSDDMRNISYYDETFALLGYTLDDGNINEFDESVKFMYRYINYIIGGNVDDFNNCFSSAYYEKVYPKKFFTMQRLYDIKLVKAAERYEDGMKVYVFKLDYKILKNDGTFRKDIDSSSSRTKTIYLTDREGRLAIDGETIYHIKYDE